ncbi:MAG: hypothetical protein Q9174_006080, partial [Haloplaca sp. 1 TL-2023]
YHLQATGRIVDTISRISHNLTGTFPEVIDEILDWAPREPRSDVDVSGGLSIDAYVEVLVRGRTSDRAQGNNPCPSIRQLSEHLTQVIAKGELDDEAARKFKDCFFVNERLFSTREGYLGVSAEGLREGDQISVILGCDFPMILRPRNSDQFEVVGPCFVHGLMLGEALKPPLKPPWKDVLPVTKGWALSYFIDAQTDELLKDDPRLGPLPTEWEEIQTLDPFLPPFVFRNKDNGHVSMNDPRMSAEFIEQRGIMLNTFHLV